MAFDALFDDPRQQGLLALGLGLLNSRGTFGQGLGQAGQQAMGVMQQAREQQRLRGMQDIQQQMAQMQLENARRSAEQESAQTRFRDTLQAPDGGGGLAFQAMKAGAMPVGEYIRATTKDNTPIKLAPGERLLNPGTYQEVASNPKAPEENEFVKTMRAAGIDPATPQGAALLRNWLQKQSTHSPGVSVTYGAPVAGVDASGNPVFFQPDKTGGKPAIIPGVAPPPRELPGSTREKMAENTVTLGKINKALEMTEAQPGAFGMQNVLPDVVTQRMDPKGVEVRALVTDIAGQKIHDRSGASATVGEMARLKPYIPNATDDAATVTKKLKLFRAEYSALQQELNSGASIGQATASKAAPAAAPAQKVRRFNPATGKLEDM